MADMSSPKNTREHVIFELKHAGSLTTKELANLLQISNTAVRQVLNALQADGLIDTRAEKQAQGRPSYVYSLTGKGQELFPDAYDTLAMELIQTVRELGGPEMLEDVMEKQLEKKEERYRLLMDGKSLLEKLRQLRELRDSDGYMAELVSDDGEERVALREYNCPILHVAKEHPLLCAHEMALMERLLGTNLHRTHHMLDGQHYCCFEVDGEQPLSIDKPAGKKGDTTDNQSE